MALGNEVVAHPGKGFQVVKHRWKVERTLAWRLKDRRRSEAVIQISMMRLLLKRLAE